MVRNASLNRRQLITGATAAVAAGAITSPSFAPGASAQSGTTALQIGRETEFAPILVPLHTSTGTQTQIFDLIYSRLLKVKDDLSFQPDAAESYEVSADATTFTFKIRAGMTWHDGTPFTANDIIFTYKLALTKATGAGAAGKLKQIKGATAFFDGTATEIEGLELVDDSTIRITLEKPNVAWLTGTAGTNSMIWILPEHIYTDADPAAIDQFSASQAPTVGSGAYQFVEYVPDQYVSFKANPSFYLGAPKIEQVFIRLAEPATQLAQLESGELHMMSRMVAKEAKRLESSDVLTILYTQGVG
ncbi:MAG: ABC transporter substrate-binding protein, partial [Thermomicrobiales bacterium]